MNLWQLLAITETQKELDATASHLMTWVYVILAVVVILGIARMLPGRGGTPAGSLFCTTCNTVGPAPFSMRGSVIVELVLWCCGLLPGLLYSWWRSTTSTRRCKVCGSTAVIPLSSPRAQAVMKQGQ